MKKKIFALFICIALMAALCLPVSAAASGSISASSVKVGDTFTVTVSVSNSTVSSMSMVITASSNLEVVSGKWLISGLIASFDPATNAAAYASAAPAAVSGKVFQATFKAKAPGNASVSIQAQGKNGSTQVFLDTVSKSAQVSCASHSFGAYEKQDSQHIRTCSACGYAEKTAHSWNGGSVTAKPSCTKEGEKLYTCTVCGHTKTEKLSKTAHTYGACTKVDDTSHSKKCTCGHTVTEKHTWDGGKVTQKATCTQEGSKTYTCTGCKATKTEKLGKTDHTYTNACDTSCNGCGASRSITHSYSSKWSSDSKNHYHACTVCGEKKDIAAHTPSDWIVDSAAQELKAGSQHKECTLCHKTLETKKLPALGCKHGQTELTGVVKATCKQPGYTGDEVCAACETVLKEGQELPALAHQTQVQNKKEPTCTQAGFSGDEVCTLCGETIQAGQELPAAAHDYADGVCTACGQAEQATPETTAPADDTQPGNTEKPDYTLLWIAGGVLAVLLLVALLLLKKRKK